MLGCFQLEIAGNADARHLCREVLDITCNQDAIVDLGRGMDNCIGQLEAWPFTPHCRSMSGDASIDFIDRESAKKAFDVPPRSFDKTSIQVTRLIHGRSTRAISACATG
jgi:hypothetical protein